MGNKVVLFWVIIILVLFAYILSCDKRENLSVISSNNVLTCHIQCTPEDNSLNCHCSPPEQDGCPSIVQQNENQKLCDTLYKECECKYITAEETYTCNSNNVCQEYQNFLINDAMNQ
jgi:hypothetical protein